MYDYMKISPFTGDVVEALLSLKSLFEIEENKALIIFNNLLDSYPEFISLETLIPYNVGEYLKTIISKEKTPYISYILFKAKSKFNLILDNEIYTYDLSKEAKEEIKEISKVLASDSGNRENNFKELLKENDAKIVENVLDTITDENIKSCKDEVKHLSLNSDNEIIIYKSLNALKTFGEELPQMELDKIQNENIKALIESLY